MYRIGLWEIGFCRGAAVVCNASRQLMRPRFPPRTPTSASDVASFELPHLVHSGCQSIAFFISFLFLASLVCALEGQGAATIRYCWPKFPGQFPVVLFLSVHPSLQLL